MRRAMRRYIRPLSWRVCSRDSANRESALGRTVERMTPVVSGESRGSLKRLSSGSLAVCWMRHPEKVLVPTGKRV